MVMCCSFASMRTSNKGRNVNEQGTQTQQEVEPVETIHFNFLISGQPPVCVSLPQFAQTLFYAARLHTSQ